MKYEHNNLTIKIEYDESPESPREWDNLGTMICSHRRYNLGDEQFNPDDFEGWEDLKQDLINNRNAAVVLPLFLYDHSGLSIYTTGETRQHEAWDSGQVGFIYVDQKDVDTYGGTPEENLENAEKCLRAEVKDYDTYLRGEVYGFTVEDPRTGEEIESCWGFYSEESVRKEAESVADGYYKREAAYAKPAGAYHG